MKRLWRHKWIVVGVSVVIFLSLGAVAVAAVGPGGGEARGMGPGAMLTESTDGSCVGIDAEKWKERREAMKEKKDQFLKRHEALMGLLRDKMSPEDQAAYDRLVEKAKEQRAALEQAREDLKQTMTELKDLTREYLDEETGAAGATGTSVQ